MSLTTLPAAVTAIPLGIAFGIILERVGLGDPRVIAEQLRGRDFTVVRVMLGAIVTAMLGVVWLGAAGAIDPGTIAIPPTDLGGQALGAVIFGGGFALAALCPGTACVAASSGRRDGLAAVAGMFIGTAVTPVVWPAVGGVAAVLPREGARLPHDLGVPLWSVVLVITLAGVIVSMVLRRLEAPDTEVRRWRLTRLEAVALTLGIAFVAVDARPRIPAEQVSVLASQITREEDHVGALQLAEWIRQRRPGLRVIDVREGLDSSTYRIPGAESVPLDSLSSLHVARGEQIVLYSDGGAHAAQAWVLLSMRGIDGVKVLKDGMAAWEDEVLSPLPPAASDDSAQQRFRRARDLALWYGGHPRLAPLTAATEAGVAVPRPRRRKTC
jgi:uncharacterized protein